MFLSELVLLCLVALVTVTVLMKWRRKKDSSTCRHPPSLPCLPLVGSLPFLRKPNEVYAFFLEKSKELGTIFTFRIGNRLVLTLNSKDAIEKAYVKNPSVFSERPQFYFVKMTNPEFKGIIFKRNPTEWKKHQQLSLSILKDFGFGVKSIMETRISKEIEALTEFVRDKRGQSFDPLDVCTLLASNIIMNVVFGRRREYDMGLSELSKQIHCWAANFNMAFDILPILRFLPSKRQQMKMFVDASKAIFECVETEITECIKNTDIPSFALAYIQKAGDDYDRDQLNYIIRDIVLAGTDTTSTSLQWSLVALANNPDVQERLYAEIETVLTGTGLPTLQDEANLPYVQATILEMTRWRTLAPMSVLRETSRDCVIDGYFIPGGTLVFPNLFAVHNDVNVWKDPEVFRPDRFLDSENNVIRKDDVIPFSIGRRSCLGETLARAELFLIITSLVQRFIVLPPERQERLIVGHKVPDAGLYFPTPFEIRLIERK